MSVAIHPNSVRECRPENRRAMNAMPESDVIGVREYYINVMCNGVEHNESDVIKKAMFWIYALTQELRLRGSKISDVEQRPSLIVTP